MPYLPPCPQPTELEWGRLALAVLAMQHDLEDAAERGDPEAQGLLVHKAEMALKRWAAPPARGRPKLPAGMTRPEQVRLYLAEHGTEATLKHFSGLREATLDRYQRQKK